MTHTTDDNRWAKLAYVKLIGSCVTGIARDQMKDAKPYDPALTAWLKNVITHLGGTF